MAHIPDGVLAAPVLAGGALVALAGLRYGLRQLDEARLPQAALLAAAFFVASLIKVPVGPSSLHLLLNGLMGLVLGWAAVPALLIALLMQAVFFGYGGLLVLGVNLVIIALPAVLCAGLVGPRLVTASRRGTWTWGAIAGAGAVALSGLLVCLALALSGPEFLPAAQVVLATYGPLMLVEAAVTGSAVVFLQRLAPELLPQVRPEGLAGAKTVCKRGPP